MTLRTNARVAGCAFSVHRRGLTRHDPGNPGRQRREGTAAKAREHRASIRPSCGWPSSWRWSAAFAPWCWP